MRWHKQPMLSMQRHNKLCKSKKSSYILNAAIYRKEKKKKVKKDKNIFSLLQK